MDTKTKCFIAGLQVGINMAVIGMALWFHNGEMVAGMLMGNLVSVFIWLIIYGIDL